MNYQYWKWVGDKEVATYQNGAVVITDDGGEVNFKSAFEACTQLREIIAWLEETVLTGLRIHLVHFPNGSI